MIGQGMLWWIAGGVVVVAGIMWLITWAVRGNKKPPMPDKTVSPYDGDDNGVV